MRPRPTPTQSSNIAGAIILSVFGTWILFNYILNPLPFFSYFSDPELAYIFSSLELSEYGKVELTDHPGTFLQIFGVPTAALASLDFSDAFSLGSLPTKGTRGLLR